MVSSGVLSTTFLFLTCEHKMAISVLLELKTERWNLDATVNSLSVSSTNYMSLGNTKVNVSTCVCVFMCTCMSVVCICIYYKIFVLTLRNNNVDLSFISYTFNCYQHCSDL